jgi:hypothetical protein
MDNPMTLTAELGNALKIVSGICWTITYLLIIRRGFQDKTYGMPFIALCANIAWEFIFSFFLPHSAPQHYIDIIWFAFDCVIFYQFLRFGRHIFDGTLLEKWFYPVLLTVLAASLLGVLTMTLELEPVDRNGKYMAFIQNLMMSVLFIDMLLRRNSSQGQSLYIAIAKMLGTIIVSYYFYLKAPDLPFSLFLYIAIFVADVIYTVLLYAKLKQEGLNPWRRF